MRLEEKVVQRDVPAAMRCPSELQPMLLRAVRNSAREMTRIGDTFHGLGIFRFGHKSIGQGREIQYLVIAWKVSTRGTA
jgi:hypothetical protein